MGQIDNLNAGQLAPLIKRVERLERAAPMNNAAVGRGGFEVYNGGMITISNGGLSVTGTATILGTLIASGIINFTGTVTISGPLTVSGLTTVTNNLVVASGGKITAGTIELNPDGSAKFGTMTISPAGKITTGSAEINPDGSAKFGNTSIDTAGAVKVGTAMTLAPATDGGAVTFSTGAKLSSVSGAVQMAGSGGVSTVSAAATSAGITSGSASAVVFNNGTWRVGNSADNVDALTAGTVNISAAATSKLSVPGGGTVTASDTRAMLQFGTNNVRVLSTGTNVAGSVGIGAGLAVTGDATFSGVVINPGITTTTSPANMYMNGSFRHYLVSSARRYKIDPQPMELSDELLAVEVKDWWDKGEYDRGEAVRRVPGVIAEEVEAAEGGDRFVTYDAEGTVQGVAYDRYALARTQVLARQVAEANTRISELSGALEAALAAIKELRAAA